jgi:hypothetical protein
MYNFENDGNLLTGGSTFSKIGSTFITDASQTDQVPVIDVRRMNSRRIHWLTGEFAILGCKNEGQPQKDMFCGAIVQMV